MSTPKDPALDDCGCCEFEPPEQPIFNPPGQQQLQYRIDTQPTFLRRMIDAIPHETVPPDSDAKDARRPLTSLTARAPDDPSIALLDAWATTADVLTFYQERIANEGFLRTSTDRRSVLELAREIGYELSPGVAAGADLAFTVESAAGAPRHVPVPIGTKVLTVPGPGQVPQTFETVIAIDARPEWNAFPPRREDPEQVLPGMTDLFLAGTNTNLQIGDAILFVGGDRVDDLNSTNWDLRLLTAVEVDTPNKRTRVAWNGGLETTEAVQVTVDQTPQPGTTTTRVFAMRKRAQLFGHNAIQFRTLSKETKTSFVLGLDSKSSKNIDEINDWDDAFFKSKGLGFAFDSSSKELQGGFLDFDINDPKLAIGSWLVLPGTHPSVVDAGTTFQFPPPKLVPSPFPLSIGEDQVDLSGTSVPSLNIEGVLLRVTGGPFIGSRTDFALTSGVTRVNVDAPKDGAGVPLLNGAVDRRASQFFVESEELPLGSRPVIVPVDGKEEIPEIPDTTKLEFQGPTGNFLAVGLSVQGLTPGQRISLVGKRPNLLVVDTNTIAQRTRTFLKGPLGDGDVSATAPIVAAVEGLLQPPPPDAPLEKDGSPPRGGLILDDPPGAREPLAGHTFELLDQIEADGEITQYHASVPLKVWKLRSRSGATGTATLPFFTVETVPPAADGETVAEIRTIVAVFQGASRMLLQLDKPLQFIYDRSTLTLSANVAKATHGETVAREVLGNGDPAVANQAFTLKKPPLTYTASPDTPSGSKSTLAVRVNGILWREVPALFGAGPDDQVYITRRTNDGQTDVIFGDGTQGARLPSGVSNVVATYRTGVGLDGQVDARTLSLLTARPLGVKGAINPLAAAGAAEPAELDDAKQNAPLTVRTIDRVVSVSDVEDFARSFAGIGKAQARLLWNGSAQVVQLTIGGADGQPIAPDAELTINLAKSLRANGDPSLLLRQPLDSFEEHRFTLAVQLDIDQRFEKPDVREAVRTALLDAFSFGRRDFGQSVGEAEILAVVQGIPGVIAANVAHLEDERTSAAGKLLTVGVARFDKDNAFHQAGLLIVNPAHLDLSQDLTP